MSSPATDTHATNLRANSPVRLASRTGSGDRPLPATLSVLIILSLSILGWAGILWLFAGLLKG